MNKRLTMLFVGVSLLILAAIIGPTGTAQQSSLPWQAPDDAKKVKNPVTLTSRGLMAASELYEQKCVLCHGDSGGGDGPIASSLSPKPADITEVKKMSGTTDGELFWKISTGRGEMPSWQSGLSETQRWQLVSYLRVLSTFRLYRYLGKSTIPR